MASLVLTQLLIIFLITIAVIALCRRIKFPPIIGYLIVGLLISVIGKNSFRHFEDLNVLAKYGVVFLLFSIGLEFSLPHLIAMRKTVFGLGSMQMLICAGVSYLICELLGLPHSMAFVIALSVAMSSTAIISTVLTETGEINSTVGRHSMSMLIFQDLMVVPAIIITGFFAQKLNGNLVNSLIFDLIKGVFTFLILIVVGKKIFTPIFNEVARAKSSELFTLTTLFIALGAGYFSELMGMSREFGAFLAGAIIGGTPYHHQVESDIRPFRDVLLGLFFIGIGTMINFNLLIQNFGLIFAIGLAIVIGKLLTISLLVKWLKLAKNREAVRIGIYLSQAGEFGFVLVALASDYNFFNSMKSQIFIAALILSMILSMILLRFEKKLTPLLCFLLFRERPSKPDDLSEIEIKKGNIIIIGFSRVGQWVGRSLATQGHQYLAVDIDPTLVNQTRLAGENIIYADASDAKVLRSLRVEDASAVVITFHDPVITLKVLSQIRLQTKDIPVIVRTKDDNDIARLTDAGATQVISDALEASLMLSLHLLVSLGMDLKSAIEWSENLRRDRHSMLKGYFLGEQQEFSDEQAEQAYQQRAIVIEEGHAADGKTLHALHPAGYGVDILALRKNGIVAPYPAPQARVHAGDVLVAAGLPDNLDRFAWFLVEGS